ncbi:hypothetical protein OB919_15185 [Halobacteria archaeon AArc-curdl1]|uniref:DUF7847 domain-containing protein n=1 Tax=Natronosalvus hydrolyticus TaxID=2979988 RepID=A0AAP2ZAS0_9EURY|nr:hypothetical protein [Halobacteria archaeon AArc-curdl1]
MAITIIDAMTDGYTRTATRAGAMLVAVFAVLSIASAVFAPTTLGPAGTTETAVGAWGLVTGVLSFVFAIGTVAAAIVALRTFAAGETERIPRALARHKIGFATLNAIVGAIVFGILVAAGTILFVIPGLFVLVSLYYWAVFVAVEDDNALEGFRRSYRLTRGNRIRLFGLGVAVVGLGTIALALVSAPLAFFGIAGALLGQVAAAVVTVYALATTVSAYEQLQGLEGLEVAESRETTPGTPA